MNPTSYLSMEQRSTIKIARIREEARRAIAAIFLTQYDRGLITVAELAEKLAEIVEANP